MDISTLTTSTRLLDAFEKIGVSEGSGLVSSGPSPAPKELVQKFEALMEQGPEQGTSQGAEQAKANAVPDAAQAPSPQGPDIQTDAIRPADEASLTQQAEQQSRNTQGVDAAAHSAEAPLMNHMDLYRLQFQVAMFKVQGESGSQISQKAAQGMDSLLRQQS